MSEHTRRKPYYKWTNYDFDIIGTLIKKLYDLNTRHFKKTYYF